MACVTANTAAADACTANIDDSIVMTSPPADHLRAAAVNVA
jgi:hypothetical protein